MQAKILKAIWDGKGFPVTHAKIQNAMYEDDVNGGPSEFVMYNSMKARISEMRVKLREFGINIIADGKTYQRYQLSLAG